MGHRDLALQLEGFSLTTAEILYRLPDHPSLIQSYVWQDYDQSPLFPRLKEFLDFWSHNLEGRLYRIRVAHKSLIQPREFRFISRTCSCINRNRRDLHARSTLVGLGTLQIRIRPRIALHSREAHLFPCH